MGFIWELNRGFEGFGDFFEDFSKVFDVKTLKEKSAENLISSVWPKTCVRDILKYKNHISIIIWSSSGTDSVLTCT